MSDPLADPEVRTAVALVKANGFIVMTEREWKADKNHEYKEGYLAGERSAMEYPRGGDGQ